MNDADDDSLTWTDVIDATIDEEVSRDEAIQLTAEDLAVDIPIHFDVDTDADVDADADVMSEKSPPDHDRARWRFDGTLNVTVEGVRGPLSEWLRLWTRE
jgi:hypothetical protein